MNDNLDFLFRESAAEAHRRIAEANGAAETSATPEGWVLVPREPTEPMLQDGARAYEHSLDVREARGERGFMLAADAAYRAMLAAAPEPCKKAELSPAEPCNSGDLSTGAERTRRERDEAEMALRRLVWRHQNGIETTWSQWNDIYRIANRNANPLREGSKNE